MTDPPSPPRWHRRPKARRDELLDAALNLFATKGVSDTTVADIAAQAGVAKGSVYRYFSTKEALLSALKDRFFDQMMGSVAEVVAASSGAGFFEVADTAIAATVRFLFDQADLVELWCRETPPEGSDEFSRGIAAMVAMYEAAISQEVAAGHVACADPGTTALLLVYAVEGAATHSILRRDSGPGCDRIIASAQQLTRRVLSPPDRDGPVGSNRRR